MTVGAWSLGQFFRLVKAEQFNVVGHFGASCLNLGFLSLTYIIWHFITILHAFYLPDWNSHTRYRRC